MPGAGLCDSCVHEKIVRSSHESEFVLCQRSKDDPSFPRYPPLPVRTCAGFERKSDVAGAASAG